MAKPSWIATNPSSGTGGGSVNVIANRSTSSSPRSGTITVKTASGLTKTVSVSQAAYVSTVTIRWNVDISNQTGSQLILSSQVVLIAPDESSAGASYNIYLLNSGAYINLNPGGGTSINNMSTAGLTQDIGAGTRSYTRYQANIGSRRIYGSGVRFDNHSFSIDGDNSWRALNITLNLIGGGSYTFEGSIPIVNYN